MNQHEPSDQSGEPLVHPELGAKRVVMGATVPSTVRAFMKDQAVYLADRGWDVHIVTSPGPEFAVLQHELRDCQGVRIHAIPMNRTLSPLADLRALQRWLQLLRELRPDVVISGTPKAGLLGMIAARLASVRARVYLVRGLRIEGQQGSAAAVGWLAEKVACWAATSIVCVSQSLRDQLHKRRIAALSKTRVLGSGSSNGVDTNRFRPPSPEERRLARQSFNIPQDSLVVGFAGRLTPDKGIDSLVTAMKSVVVREPRATLLLVGDLDEAAPLASSSLISPELPWIHHFKRVEDMPRFYWALDVFCLPSVREGMPNVNLEAASSGLPVVTTSATGCRDSVLPGVSGLCIDPRNGGALSETLLWLLAEESLRKAMGTAGCEWVVRMFRQEVVAGRTNAHLIQLLASPPDGGRPL